jgi:hypothetical protein
VAAKSLEVLRLHFWKGTAANFEGYFTMNSYHPKLTEIKKEINEATIEFPKYQLDIRTEDSKIYKVTDCWIDKLEFENNNQEYTKCYFLCNDMHQLTTLTK